MSRDTVTVRSADVTRPVAVRYAWANNPIGNLVNAEGLPASPFRTDDWTGITKELTPEEVAQVFPEPQPVDIPYSHIAITLDGDLSEWDALPYLALPMLRRPSGACRLCWREDGLYGSVEVRDTAIYANLDMPWAGDSVEFFLDRDFSRGISRGPTSAQYCFSPAPDRGPGEGHAMVAYDPREPALGQLRCVWQPVEGGYVMEFMVPAALMAPAEMKPGQKLGFHYALNNDGTALEQFFTEKNVNWGRPAAWGCIRLVR